MIHKRSANMNIKKAITEQLSEIVEHFAAENQNVCYYAMAVEINNAEAEAYVSFNTNFDFYRRMMQLDIDATQCSLKELERLKFTTKHWNYQSVGMISLIDPEILDFYYGTRPESLVKFIMKHIYEMMDNGAFDALPKSDDFKIYCAAYDENVEKGLRRIRKAERMRARELES